MVKKIAIFGATGGVGLHVTEIALKKDFQLKVLVRDPSRLREDLRSKVEVIQGDVTNASDMFRTVEGQDAVVVVLGTRDSLMVIHPDYRGKGLGKFIMACTEDYVRSNITELGESLYPAWAAPLPFSKVFPAIRRMSVEAYRPSTCLQ